MLPTILISLGLIGADISADAKAWDVRQSILKETAKDLNKTLSRNSRAVRRGVENRRVEGLIQEIINRTNRRFKAQGAYLLISQNAGPAEKQWKLTAHEIEQALATMDPYRREFAESCMTERKIVGALLVGRALPLVDLPESLAKQSFIDLENYTKSGDRRFDEIIRNFQRRGGNKYYALVLPQVDLLDASYSASDEFTVEQMSNGNINVYQERRRERRSDVMAAQIISQAPRNLLFIGKDDLPQPLKADTQVKSYIIDAFSHTRADLLSSTDSDAEVASPPEPETAEPEEESSKMSRHRQFNVNAE